VTAAEIARLRGLVHRFDYAANRPLPWSFDGDSIRDAADREVIRDVEAASALLSGVASCASALPALLDALEKAESDLAKLRAAAREAEASSETWRIRYMGVAGALRSFLTTQAQTPKIVETIRALERDLGWTSPLLGESREGEVKP